MSKHFLKMAVDKPNKLGYIEYIEQKEIKMSLSRLNKWIEENTSSDFHKSNLLESLDNGSVVKPIWMGLSYANIKQAFIWDMEHDPLALGSKIFLDASDLGKFLEKTEGIEEIGYFEFIPGCYLMTQKNAILDQKTWADEDEYKKTDLTDYKYWVQVTGDFTSLEGFDNLEDIFEAYKDYIKDEVVLK